MDIKEIRQKYPEYNDMSDADLATALHKKHYSDMPFKDFAGRIGYKIPSGAGGGFGIEKYGGEYMASPTGEMIPLLDYGKLKEMSHPALKTGAGIAGDIAGTLLAPQLKGPQLGIRALNLLSRAGGAGMGSMAGSLMAQPDVKQAGIEGLIGTGGELAFGTAGAIGKALPDLTVAGRLLKKSMQRSLREKTTERATKFIADLAPEEVRRQKVDIESMAQQIRGALDEATVLYNASREPMEAYAKKHGGISLGKTSQYLYDLEKKLGSKEAVFEFLEIPMTGGQAKVITQVLEDNLIHPRDVQMLLSTVFKQGRKQFMEMAESTRGARETLKGKMMDDISVIPGAAEKKKEADLTFKAAKQFEKIYNLVEKATWTSNITGERRLNPAQLSELIYANKKKILSEMPDIWPKLEKEAIFMDSVAKKLKESYIENAKLQAFTPFAGAAIGTASMGATMGIPVVEGIGAIMAYDLVGGKSKDILKQFMKGIGKTAIHLPGGLRFGDRE